MNFINSLHTQLSSEEVKMVNFGDVAKYIRGITYNKTQEARENETNAHKVLRANNITLATNTLNFDDVKLVKTEVRVKEQQILHANDILICAGSGSKDHVGKVAYIYEDTDYTFGGFMAVIRTNENINSRYMFHVLTSCLFKSHLDSALNSTTINNLNAGIMNSFEFPLPSLEIQNKIVEILDNFVNYAAELQAELQARKEQYEYYRNQLLTRFTPEQQVREYSLGELGTIIRGNGLQKKDFSEEGVGCIHYGQIYTRYRTYATETFTYVPDELAKKLLHVQPGNLVIACTSENVEDVCKCVAWLGEDEIVTGGHACVFRHNQNPKYIAYFFQTEYFFQQKKKYAYGAKVIDIKPDSIAKIRIPLPSLEEQNRIVTILDKFEALVNDLSQGLPAEIAAVQEQYEYYRNKLMTF